MQVLFLFYDSRKVCIPPTIATMNWRKIEIRDLFPFLEPKKLLEVLALSASHPFGAAAAAAVAVVALVVGCARVELA